MDAEKIRNLTGPELVQQQRDLSDQLFRLKFQLKMGQTESLKKLQELRKDVARIKTIVREQELGIKNNKKAASASSGSGAAAAVAKKTATPKPAAAKPAAKRGGPAKVSKPVKATATTKRKK